MPATPYSDVPLIIGLRLARLKLFESICMLNGCAPPPEYLLVDRSRSESCRFAPVSSNWLPQVALAITFIAVPAGFSKIGVYARRFAVRSVLIVNARVPIVPLRVPVTSAGLGIESAGGIS